MKYDRFRGWASGKLSRQGDFVLVDRPTACQTSRAQHSLQERLQS